MKRRDVLLAVVGLLLVWQVAAWLVNRIILPGPLLVAQVFFDELIRGDLVDQLPGQPVAGGGRDGPGGDLPPGPPG